jgi:hypothetical protein
MELMVMEVAKKESSAPTWKRRKRNIKWAQGKGINNRAIFFDGQDTIESVTRFRIVIRTMKRGKSW